MKYGIKAYGQTKTFKTKRVFKEYLMKWILSTEGSEQSRASLALANLQSGINFTDTDAKKV